MKSILILGSTGSIGTQTLDLVARFPDRLQVVALTAGRNVDLLIQQAKQFRPSLVSVARAADVARVREALNDPELAVTCGEEGLCEAATQPADLMIGALVGRIGLEPTLAALERGTDVALANKEVLVVAGELVLGVASRCGARIVPLDSEHVAIHQCLAGHGTEYLERVVLTASGGPFLNASDAFGHRRKPFLRSGEIAPASQRCRMVYSGHQSRTLFQSSVASSRSRSRTGGGSN